MKKQTLKELIEIEFDRCETISQFKQEVFRLVDLYENDDPVSSINTRKIVWDFYNYVMDECDGNLHEYQVSDFIEFKNGLQA